LKGTAIKKPDFRLLFSGLLPLFILAHFGHHMVGAMLRPLMPMIRTDLDLNYTQVGIVLSVFAVTFGISQLPGGWLADRIGTRLVVTIGVSGVALAGLLIGFSPSYTALIAFLALAAIMGGGYHPASATAISASVPSEHRGRALGFHLIGGSSSLWVTPLLAAPIAVAWGWRGSYIALSIPAIILGIVLYILIGRYTQVRTTQPQIPDDSTLTTPSRIRWGQLAPFLIMSVATGMMVRSVSAYLSLYAVDHFGLAEATAAILVTIAPGVGLFAAPLGGYLADRFGGVPVVIVVSILAGPLIYLMGVAPDIPTLIVVLIIIGFISNTRMPASEAYIIGHTPEHRRSTILGFYFFAGAETAGLLTPVIGNLIDRFGFRSSFSIASATVAAVTVVCSLFLWRNRAQGFAARILSIDKDKLDS